MRGMMKVCARYRIVTIYPSGDFWIIVLYKNRKLDPVQFSEPHKDVRQDYIKSLLEYYGFELVKMEDLPE